MVLEAKAVQGQMQLQALRIKHQLQPVSNVRIMWVIFAFVFKLDVISETFAW